MLLGVGTPGRAAAQFCPIVETTPGTDSVSAGSSDTATRGQPSQPSAPGDGSVQGTSAECDTAAPTVTITPGHSTHTAASVAVTITWGDAKGLDPGTRRVRLNGVDVTSEFSYSGSVTSAQSTGTVTLAQGQNSLEAHIWDASQNHGTANATYTRAVPAPTSCPAPQFLATYYSGLDLAGSPISTVCEAEVDHNWGAGSVGGTVGGDYFSARWVRRATFPEGTHRFTVTADDGVRLWVGGVLLIDRWVDQGPTTYTADRVMTAGEHEVRVEYYERGGGALVRAGWSAVLAPMTAAATPSLHDVVRGIYRQVKERDAVPADVQYWVNNLQAGWTVKQAVRSFATSPEHYQTFVAGKPAREVVATIYRHVYAREPWPSEVDYWEATAARGDWVAVVDGLLAWWEYAEWFGDHAVPGRPVALWDARRAPLVLEPQSGYADVERDLCLTVAVAGGASECGDLRLAHALPAIRSLNKVRAPVLIYNSQHARPMPVVAARVMLPAERGTPSSVQAVLLVGPNTDQLTARATLSWPGSAWPVGQPRRIALTYDAWNQATGVYRYAVQVSATYPDGSVQRWTMRGSLAVVNRRESTFGAGWWLAGLERLQLIEGGVPTSMLWMGGDGSTRIYEPLSRAPTSVWVGRTPDRGQDTVWAVSDYPGARYMRRLPGKVRVYFDATGKHIATVNRLDHHTRFTYDASGRLGTLQVPTGAGAGGAGVSYVFGYGAGGPNGRLYSVTAPDLSNRPTRRVVVGPQNGDHRVWTIQDPDQKYVEFAYFDGGRPEVVSRRTDRRRMTGGAHYSYGGAGRLVKVSFDMGEMVNGQYGDADDLTTWLTPTDIIGLDGALHNPDAVHALVDGPRTDVVDATRFWLNRFGSPWRIVDAGQRETVVTRGDSRFPALATRVDGPVRADGGRQTMTAEYDARGNLKSQTDWSTPRVVGGAGRYPATRYERRDPAWPDFVTTIVPPEQDSTVIGYDARGNRAYVHDARGANARTDFYYGPSGLLSSSRTPTQRQSGAVQRDSVEYDGAGNLRRVRTPLGFWSTYHKDAFGRDTLMVTPIDAAQSYFHRQRIAYDSMDRVRRTVDWGPAWNGAGAPSDSVIVTNYYDAEGGLRRVDRRMVPDPNGIGMLTLRSERDAAGRVLREFGTDATPADSLDNPVTTTTYDPAGNPVRVVTSRGAVVTTRYDALNRPFERISGSVSYPEVTVPGYNWSFPAYSNGMVLPADTALFSYDEMGNVLSAINRDARVSRTYYPNGALRTDTLRIRTWTGDDFTRHVYGLAYQYDLNGRRTQMALPYQMVPRYAQGIVGRDTVDYAYTPWGQLKSVDRNTFHYNLEGQLDSLHLGNGVYQHYFYDADGRLQRRVARGTAAHWYTRVRAATDTIYDDRFSMDARGKIVYANVLTDSVVNEYNGLGYLIGVHRQPLPSAHPPTFDKWVKESFSPDPLGNQLRTWNEDSEVGRLESEHAYEVGTGRLTSTRSTGVTVGSTETATGYDRAGNQIESWKFETTRDRRGILLRLGWHSRMYYDGGDRLRVVDQRPAFTPSEEILAPVGGFEEYRYDALGRRIATRIRMAPAGAEDGFIRRFVWDGDQLLYETNYPGADSQAEWLEQDTATYRSVRSCSEMRNCGAAPEEILFPYRYSPMYGRVQYLHGPGIDAPLMLTRIGYGADTIPLAPFDVYAHADWRGAYSTGTSADGGGFFRQSVAHPSGNSYLDREVRVDWPGVDMRAYLQRARVSVNRNWMGGLITGQQDATGLMYRRNRYYDPQTGRFTQEDPIGLAGGLNTYGFAAGDPVTYSDPYGLASCDWMRHTRECMAQKLRAELVSRGRSMTLTEARYYVVRPVLMLIVAGVVTQSEAFGAEMQEAYPHLFGVNNAARHQFGQCLMSLTTSEGHAKETADLHEAETAPDDRDSHADQENNARGRQTASRYSRPSVRDAEAHHRQRQQHCADGTRANIESGNYSWSFQ